MGKAPRQAVTPAQEQGGSKKAPKQETKGKKDGKRFSVKTIYQNYKGEYKKIVWPKRDALIRSTFEVIVTSAIFGAIICGFDAIYKFGYSWFAKLF